ncbi:MAG: hypothetical protein KDB01_13320 [Planctomycetaceae bacterium]|nr:hypothetical protein [Planctomycetaceae bacterium]
MTRQFQISNDNHRWVILALWLALSPGWWLAAAAEDARSIPAGQRQLFLDDDAIAKVEHLERTLHQPKKRGAVIRSANPSQSIQTRTSPVWDPAAKHFKLWVMSTDEPLRVSSDGLHWTPGPRPNLRIDHVVYDPLDEDPGRRFKASLLNEGFAVSPDGVQWTKLDLPAIPSSDEGNFSYDPEEGLFIHSVKRGGPFGRSVAIATSRDFRTWLDYGVVFHADPKDQELGGRNIQARTADLTLQQPFYNAPQAHNVDVYNMGVFHYEGIYVGLPAMFHATGPVPNYPNTDGFHLIQLACSRDLKSWVRLGDRKPFIGPSRLDSGAYDLTQILPPSAPVLKDDELWFYYTGLKYRANFTYLGKYPDGRTVPVPGRDHDVGAVCLAVLRRDGFISLDAGEEPGTLLTKPFVLPGSSLHINADATSGDVNVTVLDDAHQIVAVSEPVTGDQPRAALHWKSGGMDNIKGKSVRLSFSLRHARLYSFWSE